MNYVLQCQDVNCGGQYPADLGDCPKCGSPRDLNCPAPVNPLDYGYDIEVYPNVFTCRFIHISTDTRWRFEISHRVNELPAFVSFVSKLGRLGARMVGFNNLGYDYPVVHHIMTNPLTATPQSIYAKSDSIINGLDQFGHMVWPRDRIVQQLDLYKIHHFDNKARRTSLKALEIAMKMDNVEELPFTPGTVLNGEQIDVLHKYNDHDVVATCMFYARTLDQIHFREDLSKKYNDDFSNHNDAKIGEQIFVKRLEQVGVKCFDGRQPRQTPRPTIHLADVIFPYVQFERPGFQAVLDQLRSTTLVSKDNQLQTKGVLNLTTTVEGIEYKFGTGGVHAADDCKSFFSNDEMSIEMRDVTSYYPSMAIKNRLFPAHLGEQFCDVYEEIFNERRKHAKGTNENKALKLSLNGTYGNLNNKYSCFFDPFQAMTITLNGQCLLCMLVEQLIKTPDLRMINVNTDGVGFIYPRKYRQHVDNVCKWWEDLTMLNLETDEYKAFHQLNVNNYIAVEY